MGSGSAEINALPNLINSHPDTDEIYLYGNDSLEAKYPFLIDKHEVFA